jgi:hypothetical protein
VPVACIDCDALRSASAFITFEGHLLPCCYVGLRFYWHRHRRSLPNEKDIADIFDGFDMSCLDIGTVGFEAALSGYGAFMRHLEARWPGHGPKVCQKVCGRPPVAAATPRRR